MKLSVCLLALLFLLATDVSAQRKRKPVSKPSPTPTPAVSPIGITPRRIEPTPTPDLKNLPPKVYALTGKIEAIYRELKTLSVEHNTIPGYMESMTMKFPVKDAKLIEGLKVGDFIEAQLHVSQTSGDWWLSDIRRRKQ